MSTDPVRPLKLPAIVDTAFVDIGIILIRAPLHSVINKTELLVSSAIPRGEKKDAAVPTPSIDSRAPFPATVDTRRVANSILRMR